jgi:lambda family phage tail tape measure protein
MKDFVKQNKEMAPIAETVTRGIKRVYDNLAKLAESAIAATVAFLGLSRAYDAFKAGAEDFNKPLVIVGAGAMEMPEDYFKKGREARREVIEANQKLNDSLKQIRANYEKNKEATDAAAASEVAFAMMATDIADQIKAQQQAYQDLQNTIDELIQKRNELSSKQTEQKALIDSEIAALQAQIPVALENARVRVEALQEVRNAQQELIRQNELLKNQLESDLQLNQLRDQIELIGLMGDKLEDAQLIMQVSQTLEQQLLELRKQELDLIARKGQLTEEQFKKELAQINALRMAASERANKELEIKREQKEKERELENNYIEGIKKALEDMADQFKPINLAQDAVKRGFDALGDAIDDFVETGKFSFKQFAASVIADIAKIVAKALVLQAIKTIFGGFGIPGLAEGGPAKAGKPYIVGEKGPELFVPKTSGTVVPNNAMKNGVATGAVNAPVTNNYNTYNINAVDAKSVAQLFAENRKVLLGTVKMAERELPYMA